VKYTSGNEELKIIRLLKDVRDSVALLRPDLGNERLENILDAVEKGEMIISKTSDEDKLWVELNYNVDLSDAKKIVDDYKAQTEKGCEHCGNIGKFYKDMETYRYCKIGESENSVAKLPISDKSTKINQFYKTGCEDRTPSLRPLEEVLIENKE